MKKSKMMIGGWVEPIATLADYQLAKDAGLTHMFVGDDAHSIKRGTPEFFRVLDLCEKAGLKAIVRMGNTFPLTDKTDYSRFPAVDAINYWDEPFDKDFHKVAGLLDYHLEKYGDKLTFFINLNPNESEVWWHPWSDDKSYKEYVNEFCRDVLSKVRGRKILSCDIYPLTEKDGIHSIKSTWLAGVKQIALSARKYGADTHFFVQAAKDHIYPLMTEETLRFQFFTEMAFGIRNFTYYTYSDYGTENEPGYHRALVSNTISGQTRPVYDYAKTMNAELKALQDTYLSFEWLYTIPLIGTENKSEANPNFEGLIEKGKHIEFVKQHTASQDTLFGVFRDENGRDGLIVTNFTHPADKLTDTVKLEFYKAERVNLFSQGTESIYELKNNILEFSLAPGHGAFLIPSK